MQFKFLLIALIFAVIVNAQQTGDPEATDNGDENNTMMTSMTESPTASATETTSAMESATSELTSSMSATTSATSSETSATSGTASETSATETSTGTPSAANAMSFGGFSVEMIALTALFITSFIVVIT